MRTKHTPGPWKANGDPYVSTADGKRSIAFCDTRNGKEDKANAQLISAAPDLLEALQFVMTAHGEQLDTAFAQAQDAIAKATGETQ